MALGTITQFAPSFVAATVGAGAAALAKVAYDATGKCFSTDATNLSGFQSTVRVAAKLLAGVAAFALTVLAAAQGVGLAVGVSALTVLAGMPKALMATVAGGAALVGLAKLGLDYHNKRKEAAEETKEPAVNPEATANAEAAANAEAPKATAEAAKDGVAA